MPSRRQQLQRCRKRKKEEQAQAAQAARLTREVREETYLNNVKEQQRQQYIDEQKCNLKDPGNLEPESGVFRTLEDIKNVRKSYTNFESDIYEALELFHVNAGPIFDFSDVEKLKQEIQDQTLTEAERQRIEKNVCERRRIGQGGKIYTCASCGVRDPYEMQYYSYRINDLDILKYDEIETDARKEEEGASVYIPVNENEWKHVNVSEVRSVYKSSNGLYYHLHAEFCQNEEAIQICKDCHLSIEQHQMPDFAIGNGVDFGDYRRLGLTKPNACELSLISLVNCYIRVVKVTSNTGKGRNDYTSSKFKGHMICFETNAPQVADELLLSKDRIDKLLKLHFVGPDNKMDKLMAHTRGSSTIKGRSFVIYQWLTVLKKINNLYKNLEIPKSKLFVDKYIDQVNEGLIEKSIQTTNQEDLFREAALGDDVADVRTKATSQTNCNNGEMHNTQGNNPTMTSAFVSHPKSIDDAAQRILEAAADALDMKEVATRGEKLNEFERNDFALSGSFPHVFMFGRAYSRCGGLNDKQRRHLLLQYTTTPATTSELIYFLFNQLVRHNNMKYMSQKIKGNPKSFAQFGKYLESKEFKQELKEALKTPESKKAKDIVRRLMPFFLVSAKESRFGCLDAEKVKDYIDAMTKFRGPASAFLTIAPDDVNNPRTLRLSIHSSDNNNFPATCNDAELLEEMTKKNGKMMGSGQIEIPVAWRNRATAASSNPVATSLEYIRLMQVVMEEIVGLKCDIGKQKHVKTKCYLDGKKGIIGRATAAVAVNEAQQRGALHIHMAIYGGITPEVLQFASDLPEVCDIVAKALDEIYTADLPRQIHVADLLNETLPLNMRVVKQKPALQAEKAALSYKGVRHSLRLCTSSNGIHAHKPHRSTCYKGPNGCHGCRLCRPLGLMNKTEPRQLDPLSTEEDGPVVCLPAIESNPNGNEKDISHQKFFPPNDGRMIVWELKRQEMEGIELHDDKIQMLQIIKESLYEEDWAEMKSSLESLSINLLKGKQNDF